MSSTYRLTNKAVDDLTEIWNYTYETWSENQADKYYNFLINGCHEISNNPAIGKRYKKVHNDILGLTIGKHIIFYREVTENLIEIIRILHVNMDLKNRLKS